MSEPLAAARTGLQRNDVTPELLGRLARLQLPADERVVSFYLDLDPSESMATPRARRTEITSLTDHASRLGEGERGLSHQARMRLRRDIERVHELLERHALHGELAERARGLAVFASEAVELLEALRLPRPVRSRAVVARRPLIQPLAEIGPPRWWAVLLTDGDDARLLEGCGEGLVERTHFADRFRRRGGRRAVWAPERTREPLTEEELVHVRRSAELLAQQARERRYEQIVVGASERIWTELQRLLPADVLDRVVGRFDIDADETPPSEVWLRARPLLEAAEAERQRVAIARLAERGACGLEPTLEALLERRVKTLLLLAGLEHPGAVCPRCGHAATQTGSCPLDGTMMEREPNIIDLVCARAIEQDAEVLALVDEADQGARAELKRCGGVAALLR